MIARTSPISCGTNLRDNYLCFTVMTLRKIIHIDMDAFYASVEQRDHPQYRGKPVAVRGSPGGRGVVAAASYEARKFGVRSAMPSRQARQLCPALVFVRPRFEVYSEVSKKIRAIFQRYTDLIEPLSLDEAYLDVTEDKQNIGSAIEIARRIRQAIRDELNLTASAGVSINKFVAKIASDLKKPDGLTFIGPSKVEKFMETLPVEKFYGVGKVTAQKMKNMGLHKGADLKKLSEAEMIRHFGKPGKFYFKIVRGLDDRPVQPFRDVKSVGAEDTFEDDLTSVEEMNLQLDRLAELVSDRLMRHRLLGRTITVKIKFSDFKQITRRCSGDVYVCEQEKLAAAAKQLLELAGLEGKKVRLLGITVSNFKHTEPRSQKQNDDDQLSLF